MDEDEFCRCGDPAEPPHVCPYRAELSSDYETECNCCSRCLTACCDDI